MEKVAEAQGVLMNEAYAPSFIEAFTSKMAEYGLNDMVQSENDLLIGMEIAAAIKQAEASGSIPTNTGNPVMREAANKLTSALGTKQAAGPRLDQDSLSRILSALDVLASNN